MATLCAVVPAAGRGLRMGHNQPKQFLKLAGRPILTHTLQAIEQLRPVPDIILVAPGDCLQQTRELAARRRPEAAENPAHAGITVVPGGMERQDSIFNALRVLPDDCEWVMIHDGVRPFVSQQLLQATLHAARETGAAIAAIPVTDTVKRVRGGQVAATLPRDELWLVQTPQVFEKEILVRAYREAPRNGWSGTDDASLVERLDVPVQVVQGERSNIKITTPEDLEWGTWWLQQSR